jgi:K(+)-stimulated pyrophosphate-energized sodium pump
LLCSIAAIGVVKASSSKSPALALRLGTFAAAGGFVFLAFFLMSAIDVGIGTWWATVVGSVGGVIIGLSTEYYTRASRSATSPGPVRPAPPPSSSPACDRDESRWRSRSSPSAR